MSKKPQINRNICIGCGTCQAICPQVFSIDENSLAFVKNPEGAGESEIQVAMDSCPAHAISWQEE